MQGVTEDELQEITAPPPKVPIIIGRQVKHCVDGGRNIVFLFGMFIFALLLLFVFMLLERFLFSYLCVCLRRIFTYLCLFAGGPGSMKGAIIEDICTEFGFQMITTADIVLNYLPNKVANTVTTAREIQDLIKVRVFLIYKTCHIGGKNVILITVGIIMSLNMLCVCARYTFPKQ
jgi:hypothetical protein